jgi:hypothetical protein
MEAQIREVVPSLPSARDIARITHSPRSLLNELAASTESKNQVPTESTHEQGVSSDAAPSPSIPYRQERPAPETRDRGSPPPDPSLK